MSKPKWNYLVDVMMFTVMGGMIFIGVLMAWFLSSGPVSDETTKYVWGLHRHQWGDIHMILSFVFVGLLLLHIILHWSWIKGSTRKLLRSPAMLVLILLLPALVILVSWTLTEKDSPAYAEYGRGAGARMGRIGGPLPPPVAEDVAVKKPQPKKVEINGRMSLRDIEKATGIPARKLADELGLPEDAPLDQNLGRMRRVYDFQIEQVRELINRLSGGKIEAVDSDAAGPETHSEHQPAAPGKGLQQGQGRGLGRGQGRGLRQGQGRGLGQGQGQGQGLRQQEINGRLSLAEVERLTGVPAGEILKKLNLPPGTSRDERLGRLRRRYGFSIQQVRDAISALKKK